MGADVSCGGNLNNNSSIVWFDCWVQKEVVYFQRRWYCSPGPGADSCRGVQAQFFEFIQGVPFTLRSGHKTLIAHKRVNVEGFDRCRVNVAHRRQSRPSFGLGAQVSVLKNFDFVPTLLGSGFDLMTAIVKGTFKGVPSSYGRAPLSEPMVCLCLRPYAGPGERALSHE